MPQVKLTTWIDAFNFNRVCEALKERGYVPPTLPENSTGTHAMNICDQYQADFTRDEMLAIIHSVMCWTPSAKYDAKVREETASGLADHFFPEEPREGRIRRVFMSNRNRFISQVAGIIHDRASHSYGYISLDEASEDAKKVNDGDGFTFDLRDPGQGENQWSRYQNVTLNEEEMEKAIAMARTWLEKYP